MSDESGADHGGPGSGWGNEANETSGVTSALLLAYLDRVGGPDVVAKVLQACGLDHREKELRDENSWFSWETKVALFEATASILDKPDFVSEMASCALDANVGGGLKVALRTLGSPQFVLRNIVSANARFNRSHRLELLELNDGHALVRFSEIGAGHRCHRLDCDYTAELLAVIPELFGLPSARVSHFQCAAEGADACLFELHWIERDGAGKRAALAGLSVAIAVVASALLWAAALPFVGAGAAIAAGLLVRNRWRSRREQLRHLQRQLTDSEDVAERLFASLQDVVSDLRLEEVVAKVTRHAQAAVGGREFLLLVRDGDGLVCQSSSGLPAAAVAVVEAWANGSPRLLERSLLLDDVTRLPVLTPLAELDNPLCALASAPLTSLGEPFGLLVALGGRQLTFLPRDVSVLESYAAQVAIALSNARLYQNQRSLAARDPLTGLLNHRSFQEAIDAELAQCAHEQFYSSVVLIDLDHFKQVNDEDGHAAGDHLLRSVARAISDVCRRDDLAFRIGGDEFALLLSRLAEREAVEVASRVCRAIAALDPRIGASAGVACAGPQENDKAGLLAGADSRLYAAKRGGLRAIDGPSISSRSTVAPRVAIDLLLGAMELHHGATVDHCDAVAKLAEAVAARLGLDARECELVGQTALVHDLGKLAVPRALLNKTGRLTEAEWEAVRQHPDDGAQVLLRVDCLTALAEAVRASHESWDGTGYPAGLRDEKIPLPARIVAACDAFDAMTADRPYRIALSPTEAIAELHACAGTQFDPGVITALTAELSVTVAV